jgi:CxxC-x17-CxxC domain-containing protein
MAKNDSKAQKAARNLEYANKFRKKKAPMRGGRPSFPRPASAAPAAGSAEGGAPAPGQRRFYPAVCSACGTATEVPFQPVEGRQVLCRACFKPADRS